MLKRIAIVGTTIIMLLGCQTMQGRTQARKGKHQQGHLQKNAKKQLTKRDRTRRGQRAKAQQFSLYERGELDYKLLRRGQRYRFRR